MVLIHREGAGTEGIAARMAHFVQNPTGRSSAWTREHWHIFLQYEGRKKKRKA